MKILFSVFVLFVGISVSLSVSGQTIAPGYWSAVTKFKIDGLPIPDSTGASCVTPDQAKDVRGTLTSELTKIGCVITQWNLSGNEIQAALTCNNSDVRASGKVQGSFTEKTYHLTGKAHGFYKNAIPAVASIDLTGQWVRDCNEAAQN